MEKLPKYEPSIESHDIEGHSEEEASQYYEYSDEEVFRNYMEDLQLSPEDFDKKILDVGSGSAQFAKWAKEHDVSSEIYSLEPRPSQQETTKSVQGIAQEIPFQDEIFDLVISNASIPNFFWGESLKVSKRKVRNSLLEMMRVTKPGGEIRLSRVLRGEVRESHKNLVLAIDEIFNELRQIHNVKIEETPYSMANAYEQVDSEPVELLEKVYLIKT